MKRGRKNEGVPVLWIMRACDNEIKSSDSQVIMLTSSFRIHPRLNGMWRREVWHFLNTNSFDQGLPDTPGATEGEIKGEIAEI